MGEAAQLGCPALVAMDSIPSRVKKLAIASRITKSEASMSNSHHADEEPASRLVPLGRWAREIDRTPSTVWRWRKAGLISVQNVAGRLFIHRDEIARFEAAVAAGELAKLHKTPTNKAAQ
jgi:hypothetical protein